MSTIFGQYLKNNIADIRLIPLDHVTYRPRCDYGFHKFTKL